MPRGEFGNTVEFAAKAINDHWFLQHNSNPGSENRPYECETCRALWSRYSNSIDNQRSAPIPYVEVVRLVRTGASTVG
jgi:hypothetical protein